jgi:hypothetical protein
MAEDTDDIALEEEADVEESIIPEEDFREAIAVCRKDPQLNRLFEMAPPGAKLFIGLGFYSTHFGDKVDPRQYAECQSEIEPALTITDLKYLIRFERDKTTKHYLRELLAQRESEAAAETAAAEEPIPEQADAPLVLPKRKRRRKVPRPDLQAEAAQEEPHAGVPIPFKIAALVALLLGGAFVLYVATRSSAPQPVAQNQTEEPPDVIATAKKRPSRPAATPKPQQTTGRTYALVDADEEDARLHGADAPSGMEAGEEAALVPVSAETNAPAEAVAASKKRPARKPRVVFTDGKKIVKRPGGQIEVPRVFSCAGAGVKPFWVYGAHPEADAAQEKKARDEWQALVQQARQAEEEASGGTASAGANANML